MTPSTLYASFMLRLQWVRNDDRPTWLVSMQSTKTGELRRFPNLDGLIQFLQDEFGSWEELADCTLPAVPDAACTLPETDRGQSASEHRGH